MLPSLIICSLMETPSPEGDLKIWLGIKSIFLYFASLKLVVDSFLYFTFRSYIRLLVLSRKCEVAGYIYVGN